MDRAIAKLISKGAAPDFNEVQKLIQKHFELQEIFFNLDGEAYLVLIQIYEEDPEAKAFFEAYHPQMQTFICSAMRFFAHRK